jgi:protease IV
MLYLLAGSPLASETISRQIKLAQDKGKKVIASFGNVAASGGYFVAAGCDRILANPATLTGSIGVTGGKAFIDRKLWDKLGVNYEVLETANNAGLFSPLSDFSDRQVEKVNERLDRVYDDFTQRVSHGRRIPLHELDKIARGRVFTGAEAKKVGLIDEFGGFAAAKKLAAKWLGLNEYEIAYQTFPRRGLWFQSLFESIARDEVDREDNRLDMSISDGILKPLMTYCWNQLKASIIFEQQPVGRDTLKSEVTSYEIK